jgi:thymidylate synthase
MKMGEQHEEQQYLGLIRDIMDRGAWELGRNGRTKSIFGHSMRFSLKDGTVPILTTKTVAWKTCFRELMWFIRGSTDNRELVKQGVHIWDGNADRRFLDSRGLFFNKEGDLGPIYGHQWRHFNAEYSDFDTDYSGKGIDQLQYIIDQLRDPEKRSSRRLVMTAWNPCQIQQMALPPCHIMAQFNIREGKYLSCALYQRSGDVGLGVPFNIASYSFLTHILAKHCGLEAEEFVYFLGNAHIYEEHMSILTSQLQRDPVSFPRMQITRTRENVEDYSIDDMEWISEYKSLGSLKMEFVA